MIYDDKEYFSKHVENDFEEEVISDLKKRGLLVIKMPASLEKGIVLPDLLCILPKKNENKLSEVFFIEIKTPTGRLQKIQEVTFNFLKKFVDVYVIYGWEDYNNFIANKLFL